MASSHEGQAVWQVEEHKEAWAAGAPGDPAPVAKPPPALLGEHRRHLKSPPMSPSGERILASGSVQLPRFTLLESGSLLISPTHISDAGTYTCLATNSRGVDEASADLVVWGEWLWQGWRGQSGGLCMSAQAGHPCSCPQHGNTHRSALRAPASPCSICVSTRALLIRQTVTN